MPSLTQLGRTGNWWDSQIPPVLAVCYASVLFYNVPLAPAVGNIALVLWLGFCAVTYGSLINDLFDIDAGSQAGKTDHLSSLASWRGYALCSLALLLGFAPACFVPCSALSLALLAGEYLLLTICSSPSLQLKERGGVGVLCEALSAHVVPCLYTLSIFAHRGTAPLYHGVWSWFFPITGACWAWCFGVKGIVIHELQHRARNLRAGVSTSATRRDFPRIRVMLNRVYACELLAFLALLIVLLPLCPLLPAWAVLYATMLRFKISRNWNYYVQEGSEAASMEWWQFSRPFYECYLPLILAVQCAWRFPVMAPLPLIQVVLFRWNFRRRIYELRGFAANLGAWLIWRGQLHLDDGAEASLTRNPLGGVRLDFGNPGGQPWRVRLTRPYRNVRASETYDLKVVLRADRARRVTVGLWQDHAPWNSLGLSEEIQLSNAWTVVKTRFEGIEDEDRAYLGVWLGGDDAAVEIRHCSFHRVRRGLGAATGKTRRPGYRTIAGASYWNLTGAHIFEEHLLRGLAAGGMDARLLLTETETDLVELPPDLIPLPPDIEVERLAVARSGSWPAHWVTLVRLLSSRAPCIFVPNVDYRHSCVSPMLPPNVCVVGVIQSDDPVHYEHVQRLGRFWDAIVCVSEEIARKVAEMDPSFTPRLHVIPNAVDVPERVPPRPAGGSPLRVLYHGGLNTYQKRILDVAAILDECARRTIPVTVTIAGEGPERGNLLRACERHIADGSFRYLGLISHDRVDRVLRENDVYLLPSAFEGTPHALLEAMAQGCVPLVTDIRSSIPELIRNGVNGYRVPVGDIGAFVDRLQTLQADPALRTRLAEEAHRTLLGSCYDVRRMVRSYVRVFDGAMEAARTGAYRRPRGRILPPPGEVEGISIFPMEHREWAVDSAERWLTGRRGRAALRAQRFLNHFRYV